jgi:putative ABC transport system substrate-binding protein
VVPISVIFSSNIEVYKQAWEGSKGYLAGKGIDLKVAEYSLDSTDPKVITADISNSKPKIIFTVGSGATKFAKENIGNIPVLADLIMNFADYKAPNITGVSLDISSSLRLQAIKKVFPDVKRIGVVYSVQSENIISELKQSGSGLSLTIVESKAESDKDFFAAFNKISPNIDCFLMIPDTTLFNSQIIKFVLLEGVKNKLPIIGLSSFHSKAGAAMSIEADYKEIGVQTGEIALKILNGAKPSEIQVQRPKKVTFSLNNAAFEKLGKTAHSKDEASEVFGN